MKIATKTTFEVDKVKDTITIRPPAGAQVITTHSSDHTVPDVITIQRPVWLKESE